MKDEFYLIATRDGMARMTKRQPALGRNEIGVRVRITIPDGAFRSPILTVALDVADAAVLQPEIAMEVAGPEAEPVEVAQ